MPRREVDPSVQRLASELLETLDAMTDEFADRIAERIDVYRPTGLVERDELTRSLRHNLRHILGQLAGAPDADLEAPRLIGRTRASQGVPLPEILRAYRLGFTFTWQRLLDAAERSGQQSMNALLHTATTIWELSDDFSLALTESYRQRMGEQMIAADRHRSGLVATLLGAPSTAERTAWEVAKLLDLPYEGRFLVVVAEAPPDGGGPLPHLESRLRSIDVGSAWRAQPDHEIGVLSLGQRRTCADVVAMVEQAAVARVGVSPEYASLDGTARAARFARVALDALPPGTRGAHQLEDLPINDLLVRDREASRRFVVRVLGEVLTMPGDDRATLLATAEAWIDARGSALEAGRVLYCHENTVRYRMRRLEERLGVTLDDPRALADLASALQAIRVFPEFSQPLTESPPRREGPTA